MSRWVLDEIVDAFDARVLVERDDDGRVRSARFDLAGLPRVDGLLTGRPVAGLPGLIARLCGICPAAHHLAGVRALEHLAGTGLLTATADAVRSLLHHAAAVGAHAPRLGALDPEAGALLARFARQALAAAGSPGHFPDTAVPGGVASVVQQADRETLIAAAPGTLAAAVRLAELMLAGPGTGPAAGPDRFAGADVALVDAAGRPDLLGERLRAVAADGAVLVDAAPASAWDRVVAESEPGAVAPRPYLIDGGPHRGGYRVGPVAQLRVGDLTTPIAAGLQHRWRATGGGAGPARAVLTVHSVERIAGLLHLDALTAGPVLVDVPEPAAGVGVGWVDSPRGLLVHRYAVDDDGLVTAAGILTPTAQNEPWLAELLRRAVEAGDGLEGAVREADPCLPCSDAPPGAMGLRVETVAGGGR